MGLGCEYHLDLMDKVRSQSEFGIHGLQEKIEDFK